MRFTKTVKYNYTLTEETLEKDIEGFIGKARRGNYSWDYKYDGEGLKIIKQYFRILNDKFKNEEYQECKVCYEKLILFLFDASSGKDKADFGYEDLLARITNDFDKYIKNYFICLFYTPHTPFRAHRARKPPFPLRRHRFSVSRIPPPVRKTSFRASGFPA